MTNAAIQTDPAAERDRHLVGMRERVTTLTVAAAGLRAGEHQGEDPWTQERLRQLGKASRDLAEYMWNVELRSDEALQGLFGPSEAVGVGLYDLPTIALAIEAVLTDPTGERWGAAPDWYLVVGRADDVARELEEWIRGAREETEGDDIGPSIHP